MLENIPQPEMFFVGPEEDDNEELKEPWQISLDQVYENEMAQSWTPEKRKKVQTLLQTYHELISELELKPQEIRRLYEEAYFVTYPGMKNEFDDTVVDSDIRDFMFASQVADISDFSKRNFASAIIRFFTQLNKLLLARIKRRQS